MNFRKLKIFYETATELNMTKVAKKLYISQPSISQAIHEIEEERDVILFDRIGKKLFLTENLSTKKSTHSAKKRRLSAQICSQPHSTTANTKKTCILQKWNQF